jgi:DNA-binding transcriptional MerR regulator
MDRSLRAEKNRFTIGELAREFGITHRTLRFYEDKALITPLRQGQRRLYSRRDRARLKLILQGKRVGFSLKDIGEMLDLYDLRDGQVTQLRVSLERFDERIGALERQRADIDEALDDLRQARQLAAGLLAAREKEAGRIRRKGDEQT